MGFNITGIGPVPSNVAEYTTGQVQQEYLQAVAILKQIFDKRSDNPDPNSQTVTASDFNTLISTLQNLRTLAQNGATDPISGAQFYLTNDMAINLDLIFRSLQAVGITPDTTVTDPTTQISLLKNWQSLAGFGVEDILTQANSITGSTRTLQSMVEIDYVKQGNDILANKLSGLQGQLQTTQDILATLTTIQNIGNQITVTNAGSFAFPPTNDNEIPSAAVGQIQSIMNQVVKDWGPLKLSQDLINQLSSFAQTYFSEVNSAKTQATSNGTTFSAEFSKLHSASDIIKNLNNTELIKPGGKGKNGGGPSNYSIAYFEAMYKAMASAHFHQIFPVATPTSTAATDLLAAKKQLMQELVDLEVQNPGATRSTAGSLASFIYQVALDISTQFKGVTANMTSAELKTALKSAVSSWIMDNQNQLISSTAYSDTGSIQNNITQALSSAQTLNDQQKQLVQNYMFIFEQFYQSASIVLKKMMDTIEKMTQGIMGS
ncbi:hypothetical protein [Candidatus Protochlamydia phocaeensis]|uniref:hypothetical protein n=1 Tax=Candidatus Protochlamydia phocaeensis TaxID=1414722 RepID=UPI000838E8E1|nr:hypothetical protein [Candidatus Protochlamydia phocaeensis]